jgi:hypothetical protein
VLSVAQRAGEGSAGGAPTRTLLHFEAAGPADGVHAEPPETSRAESRYGSADTTLEIG